MDDKTSTIEIDLIKELNEKNKEENFVFSPLGIEIILSFFSNGAEGETLKEILKLLKYKNIEEVNKKSKEIIDELNKNEEIIKIANAILTKVKAKDKFIKIGKDHYDAKVEILKNFDSVNKWARTKTKNNINKIIDSLLPDIIMVLLNALYFEAFWVIKFDKNDSKEKPFYNLDKESGEVKTTMMVLRGTKLNYYENDFLQAVKLKYEKATSFNAIIILPKENYDINRLIRQFDNKMYEEIIEGLKNEEKLNVELPKFEIEFKVELSDILQKLGIEKAFTNDAELKGICDKSPIHINNVIQKNYINVNEEGTQAYSVTELEVILECFKDKDPNSKDFIVNRPFIFLIRDELLPKGRDILFFTKLCKAIEEEDNDF